MRPPGPGIWRLLVEWVPPRHLSRRKPGLPRKQKVGMTYMLSEIARGPEPPTCSAVDVRDPKLGVVRVRQPGHRLGKLLPEVKRVKVADGEAHVLDVAARLAARLDALDVDVKVAEVAVLLCKAPAEKKL